MINENTTDYITGWLYDLQAALDYLHLCQRWMAEEEEM